MYSISVAGPFMPAAEIWTAILACTLYVFPWPQQSQKHTAQTYTYENYGEHRVLDKTVLITSSLRIEDILVMVTPGRQAI